MEINKFKEFFIGREDTYGYYYFDNEGNVKAAVSKTALTDSIIAQHLNKEITIGSHYAYNINGIWYCKYLSIDFDSHDLQSVKDIKEHLNEKSKEIKNALIKRYKIGKANILREFSGRGYHIWIKLKNLTPLSRAYMFREDVKKFLLKSYNTFKGLDKINPEKPTVEGGYGNWVKLPLSINRNNGEYCEILDNFDLSQQGEGYKIPGWIPNFIEENPKIVKEQTVKTYNLKVEFKDEDFSYFFNHLLPCFQRVALDGTLTILQKGDNGHRMNLYLCDALIIRGARDEIIHKFYLTHPTHNREKTQSNINSARGNFDKEKYGEHCKKIQEIGFCYPDCPNVEGKRKHKYTCTKKDCDFEIVTIKNYTRCWKCRSFLKKHLIKYIQVIGSIKDESPKQFMIATPNGEEEWYPKSVIHPNYSNEKGKLQTFLIESWLVKYKKSGEGLLRSLDLSNPKDQITSNIGP